MKHILIIVFLAFAFSSCTLTPFSGDITGEYGNGIVQVELNQDGTGTLSNGYDADSFTWVETNRGESFVNGFAVVYSGVLFSVNTDTLTMHFGSYAGLEKID